MTLKNGFGKCYVSVRYLLFYQPVDEKIRARPLRFPAKENQSRKSIVLQYDVKAEYRLISRNFSGMKFFHPSVCLTKYCS